MTPTSLAFVVQVKDDKNRLEEASTRILGRYPPAGEGDEGETGRGFYSSGPGLALPLLALIHELRGETV
jgi:hypothetical protein